jgi:hypothetical protein
VGAEDNSEGVDLHPAQEELLATAVTQEGQVHGAVAAGVAVVEREAREAAAEQPDHAALDAVVRLPAHHLVALPEQHRPPGALTEPRTHEEHQPVLIIVLLLRCRRRTTDELVGFPLVGELAVDARPQLRVPVVRGDGVLAGVQPRVKREPLAEVGHPAGDAVVRHPLQDLLEPGVRLRVGEVQHGDVERGVGHHVRLAGLVPDQDAQLLGLLEQVPPRVGLLIHLKIKFS